MHKMLAAAVLLGFLVVQAFATLSPRLVPRSNIPTLPINAVQRRAIDNNPNTTAGLARVSMSSDRQSYTTIIQVGNINFRVALDTASADLWILSSGCRTKQCENVPRFPLDYQSSSFVAVNGNGTTFNARYADDTGVSGFLAREKITLPNVSVSDQFFGLVADSNVSFVDQTSGLLGLGFPRLASFLNLTNSNPFFANLAQRGLLEYPLFAFSLTRSDTGSLSIGAIDASVVKNASEIAWNRVASFPPFNSETNVSTPNYLQWAIPISSFSINRTTVNTVPSYPLRNEGRSLALIDLGASGIYGPFQDVTKLFSMIDGSRIVDPDGQWAIPCDTDVPVSFTFGSRNYTLFPEDYIIGPAAGNPNLCLSWPKAYPPHSDAIDWQFGTAFLRTVYSIFNYGINTKEPPLIGFYPIRSGNSTEPQPAQNIESFFSAHSATVATTLPNFLLPTPTPSTPPYIFNASVPAPLGGLVSSDLATSTYSAIFGTYTAFNASAIPAISLNHSVVTQTFTDTDGELVISVSTQSEPSATLGVPPGWPSSRASQDSFWISYSIYPAMMLALLLVSTGNFV